MNLRIRKLRKALDLTQAEFAEKIGTTANVLTHYETGRRNPSSSVINNICKTFNVNEAWLRTGEGEMYGPKPTAALELLAVEHDLTSGDYLLLEKFLNLKPSIRMALIDYIREVAAAIADEEKDGVTPDMPVAMPFEQTGIPITDEEIRRNAAMYEKQAQDDAYTELERAGVDPEIEAEVEAYRQRRIEEKKRASQTSAAKERGAG